MSDGDKRRSSTSPSSCQQLLFTMMSVRTHLQYREGYSERSQERPSDTNKKKTVTVVSFARGVSWRCCLRTDILCATPFSILSTPLQDSNLQKEAKNKKRKSRQKLSHLHEKPDDVTFNHWPTLFWPFPFRAGPGRPLPVVARPLSSLLLRARTLQ